MFGEEDSSSWGDCRGWCLYADRLSVLCGVLLVADLVLNSSVGIVAEIEYVLEVLRYIF